MTRSIVPATRGSATVIGRSVIALVTVQDTLPGDVVQIINFQTDDVLAICVRDDGTNNWRGSFSIPPELSTLVISALTVREGVASAKTQPTFTVNVASASPAPTPSPTPPPPGPVPPPPPPAEPPLVIYFLDNFTGTQGTSVLARPSDSGQTWAFNPSFLNGVSGPNSFLLNGTGGAARPTATQDPDNSGGEFLAYPQGVVIPDGIAFSIVINFSLNSLGNNVLYLYENSELTTGNTDLMLVFYGFNPYLDLTNVTNKVVVNTLPDPVIGQTYSLRLDINGTALSAYIDDLLIVTGTRVSNPVTPFGIDLFDSSQEAAHTVDFIKILSPPQAST
jgi:hypothetical protein